MAAWARQKDSLNALDLVPYQEAPSPPMTSELELACKKAMHVVLPNGEILRAGRGSLFVLEHIGWGWKAKILAFPPLIWFVELGYRIVANNRPFFSKLLRLKGQKQ